MYRTYCNIQSTGVAGTVRVQAPDYTAPHDFSVLHQVQLEVVAYHTEWSTTFYCTGTICYSLESLLESRLRESGLNKSMNNTR
jgi:hypothetical protein